MIFASNKKTSENRKQGEGDNDAGNCHAPRSASARESLLFELRRRGEQRERELGVDVIRGDGSPD